VLAAAIAGGREGIIITTIVGGDHFFVSHEDDLARRVCTFVCRSTH
jgi:hypothetical protein